MGEDRRLDLVQVTAGFEPSLHQCGPRFPEQRERLELPTLPVQRHHRQPTQPLTFRLGPPCRDDRAGHRTVGGAAVERRGVKFLHTRPTQLGEHRPGRIDRDVLTVEDVATPEAQRVSEQHRPVGRRFLRACAGSESPEPVAIDQIGRDDQPEPVTISLDRRLDPSFAQLASQP